MTNERAVLEVIARYVRAVDARDGAALSGLFTDDATVTLLLTVSGWIEPMGELHGREQIGGAVAGMLGPHPAGGFSHHVTADPIVEIDGDEARIDVQVIRFNTLATPMPEGGWPPEAAGAQGTVTPVEAGYYRSTLQRIDGSWKLTTHTIVSDLPYVVPQPRTDRSSPGARPRRATQGSLG